MVLASGAWTHACRPPADPLQRPVARIDGHALTVSDLNAYLHNNLGGEEGEEPAAPEDLDRVKSRLFDNFVDEEILLAEARRRGIEATDEDVKAYLDTDAAPQQGAPVDEERRRMAKRDLTIQKLREAFAEQEVRVTPGEIDAYLGAHREALEPKPRIVLRSIALDSAEKARSVYRQILHQTTTFAKAASALASERSRGEPQEVPLDSLPNEVRTEVGKLKPGQVTPPLVLPDGTYLFFLESGPTVRTADPAAIRGWAREDLLRQRYQEASSRLLQGLRARARIQLHPENLPFRYAPESPS